MLQEVLEHIVRSICEFPGDVSIQSVNSSRGQLLKIRVNPEDIGKVIGRNGRTITAIRTLINALSEDNVRVDVLDKYGK